MKHRPRDTVIVLGTTLLLNLLLAPLGRELMNTTSDWAWRAMVGGICLLVMMDAAAIAITVNIWRKQ